MLHTIDLTTTDRPSDTAEIKQLRERLSVLHRASREAELPVMVAFEGWDGAGKGSAIHTLTERLDPRGFTVHPIGAPRPFEAARPWLWRYWRKIPEYGTWGFYDRSWYGRVLVARMDGLVSPREWERGYDEILQFERALTDDGYLLIKIFLHISKDEQRQRLQRLLSDPVTVWRVTPEDWINHHRYDAWMELYEEVLGRTNTQHAPWTPVSAMDARETQLTIYRTLVRALESRLDAP